MHFMLYLGADSSFQKFWSSPLVTLVILRELHYPFFIRSVMYSVFSIVQVPTTRRYFQGLSLSPGGFVYLPDTCDNQTG